MIDEKYDHIILKTCKGWGLSRYPEAKEFIIRDVPFYREIEIDYKGGGKPRLVIQNKDGDDLKVLDISTINRSMIREVVKQLGFEPYKHLPPMYPEKEEDTVTTELWSNY